MEEPGVKEGGGEEILQGVGLANQRVLEQTLRGKLRPGDVLDRKDVRERGVVRTTLGSGV